MDTRAKLREFISKDLFGSRKPSEVTDSANLLEQGLDSLAILRLTVFIEDAFQVSVPDESVVPENIQSIDALVRLIETLR